MALFNYDLREYVDSEEPNKLIPQRSRIMREEPRADALTSALNLQFRQLHPLVAPQVLHFMHVPLRTSV